jgi:hypothetical protein
VGLALIGATHPVLAAPNSLCPGFCTNSSDACGSPEDCGGGECAFLADCLPGHENVLPLVESVLPEWARGLNDYANGWSCGLLDCQPGAGFLAFSSPFGSSAVASKDLALPPGRYLALAEMTADSGVWTYFDIHSTALEARSEPVLSPQWTRTSAAFDVPEGHGAPLQFRLHVDGEGFARIRRVVILKLRGSGAFLRVRAERAIALGLERVYRWGDAPGGFLPVVCDGAPEDPSGCLPASAGATRAEAGVWSPWMGIGALGQGTGRMTLAWAVADCSASECQPTASPFDIEVELAFAPDDRAVLSSGVRRANRRLGIVVPEARAHPFDFKLDFVGALVARDFDLLIGAPETRVPDAFKVGFVTGQVDLFDDSTRGPELFELFAMLGANTQSFVTNPVSNDDRARATLAGLKYRWLDLSEPLDALRATPLDLEPEAIAERVRAILDAPESEAALAMDAAIADFGAALQGSVFGTLGPAIGLPFAGPSYRDAFREWLAAQGDTPESLGLTSLAEALPLENATPALALETRLEFTETGDAKAARRWYRAIEFWNRASAEVVARVMGELEARLGPIPMSPRFDSSEAQPGQWLSGLAFSRLASAATPNAFLSTLSAPTAGDCQAWRYGAWADYIEGVVAPSREAAVSRGERMQMGVELQAERVELAATMLELAARGFTWFNHLAYGPRAVFGPAALGGEGARVFLDRFRAAHDLLVRAEPLLAGAESRPASVVILASESDPLWGGEPGLSRDELGWHMGLTQNAIPVDFIREDEVAAGMLSSPILPRRVLILARDHVSDAAWREIVRWVEAGGTLVLGPDLASRNEFGEVVAARENWLGLIPGDWAGGLETLRWSGAEGISSFVYQGRWRTLFALTGTELGVAEDEDAVALRLPNGRGRVIALGVDLGANFAPSDASCDLQRPSPLVRYPEDFSTVIRDVLGAIVAMGEVTPTLQSDPPLLSLQPLFTADRRPVVLAVHWTGRGSPALIHIPETAGCRFVREELTQNDLAVSYGRIFSTSGVAAIYTWDEDACVVTADEPEIVEVETPIPRDEGCGASPGAAWAAVAGVGLAWLSRSFRARRSSRRQGA